MEKLFKLKENGTTVKTEVIAGITTFLAMAYILAVNPGMLSATGMDQSAVFAATAVSAAFATLFMAFFANYPVALASGMGLNAYFTFTVVPQLAEQGITNPWQVALTAILVEGIMFGIISWVVLKVVTGKIKQIHPVMWVAAALFVVRIVTIVLGVAS